MNIDEHKKQFGIQAEDYTKYRKPYPPKLFDFIASIMLTGSSNILDLACGTGKSTEELVKVTQHIYGCDHDPLMIAEAKKQAELKCLNINYDVAEAEKLPYQDGLFDVVVVGTAFHWFVNELAMAEIKRVLKTGGLLCIFWSVSAGDTDEEDQVLGEVFQNFKWQRVPREFRDLDYISNFIKDFGFGKVAIKTISWSHEDTVDERVGLEKTNSGFGLLSTEDKIKFLDMMREALEKLLGDRAVFTVQEEIQICYGFKV